MENTDAFVHDLLHQLDAVTLDSLPEQYPNIHADINPLDLWRAHLSNIISEISGVSRDIVYPAVSWTQSLEKGDFTIAVPALRIKGTKPDVLAQEWLAKFPEDDRLFEKPVVSGHFMSFFVKAKPLIDTMIPLIRQQGKAYGRNKFEGLRDPKDVNGPRKRIIVEFSSPNVAKPFHAGHLRSTIIGGFISNLYEAAGWDVIRMNYLGDWGKQYGLLALAYSMYGDRELLDKNPIDHLFHLYVRISREKEDELAEIKAAKEEGKDVSELEANCLDEQARKYFKRMVDGDPEALDLWRRFRDLSIIKYKETYSRLNIHFDEYSGESQVTEEAMEQTARELEAKGLVEEDNGALLIDFQKHVSGKPGKQLGKTVLRKRDGTALYLTRDISELLGRFEKFKCDKMYYVVASAQQLHLKQLYKIVELVGHPDKAKACQHISFGLVMGMSTRKGTVKFLDDILNDCANHMHEVMRKNETKYSQVEDPKGTADTLGLSSVMVQDMSGKMINDYQFDMDAMTSFEGDTGPYLQYAHARLGSIKRRAQLTDEEIASADLSLLTEKHALSIVRMLAQWPDVFQNTLKTLEPTTVLLFLFRMTHTVNSSYNHLQVVNSERELMKARMALYDAARIVLANGMTLLGLTPLQRM